MMNFFIKMIKWDFYRCKHPKNVDFMRVSCYNRRMKRRGNGRQPNGRSMPGKTVVRIKKIRFSKLNYCKSPSWGCVVANKTIFIYVVVVCYFFVSDNFLRF